MATAVYGVEVVLPRGGVFTVRQVHRADKEVELAHPQVGVVRVGFAVLRTKFRQLDAAPEGPGA